MGFVSSNLAPRRSSGPRDEELIWNVIHVMNRVDGTVEPGEAQLAEVLARTVPQLRAGRSDDRPTYTRKGLLDELAALEDEGLRRQLYVIAVEAALASGDVNESEDQYVTHLGRALRIDDEFARHVIAVVGYKYARGR